MLNLLGIVAFLNLLPCLYSNQYVAMDKLPNIESWKNTIITNCSMRKCCEDYFCSAFIKKKRICVYGHLSGLSGNIGKNWLKLPNSLDYCPKDVSGDDMKNFTLRRGSCTCLHMFNYLNVEYPILSNFQSTETRYKPSDGNQFPMKSLNVTRNFQANPNDMNDRCKLVATLQNYTESSKNRFEFINERTVVLYCTATGHLNYSETITGSPGDIFCLPGWRFLKSSSRCYKTFVSDHLNCSNVGKLCAEFGAEGISIHNDIENRFILNLVPVKDQTYQKICLGEIYNITEDEITWDDESKDDFRYFQTDPINETSHSCLSMWVGAWDGKWMLANCSQGEKAGLFACQKKISFN